MRYRATEYGLILVERGPVRRTAPDIWIPRGDVMDLPPMREPYSELPKAEAFGVAGAFGTTMLGSGSGASPIGIFGASCKQWCRSDMGITLGTNPFGAGTTVQAVTLSGQAAAPIGLYIEITSTGARGTATFKYGALNSGGAMIETGVVTAASYALIGAATGITVNFPVGTYTNGDTYKGIVSVWADLSGYGNNYVGSAAGPLYQKINFGGGPSINFASGSNAYMTCTTFALGSGNDVPFTVFLEARANGVASNRVLFGMGSTTDNDPLYDIAVDNTGPTWGFSKRSDAGGSDLKTCSGGTADTNKHYFTLVNDGQTQTFYIDGSLVFLTNSGNLNVGTSTFNRMSIGGRVQSTVTLPLVCDIAEVWGIDKAADATELASGHNYFATRYP